MKRSLVAALAALLTVAIAPSAEAGLYTVSSCTVDGRNWAQNAWKAGTAPAGVTIDTACAGGIGLRVAAAAQTPDNQAGVLSFTSPAGTTIADFRITRQVTYHNNAVVSGTHRYFVLYSIGTTHFAGGGNFDNTTRNTLNGLASWYGHPESNFDIAPQTVVRSQFRALGSYAGNANQLLLRVGCFLRSSPCSVAAPGGIAHLLLGTAITINDPTAPNVTVEASGLLGGGVRNGSDPVTVTASDGAGIRRVELFDVTNPAAPVTVGHEDYGETRTDANRTCDFSIPAPCPGLTRETIRPVSLPAGERHVLVRVTDTAGNVVDQGPYPVNALTPSDRGALNGTGATDTGTLEVGFTASRSSTRTLSYGTRAGLRGRLLSSAGAPVAGAKVNLLTRDLRRDAQFVSRTTVVTAADGTFRTTVSATASREIQFGWLSHERDVHFGATAALTLRARASARLSVSTHRPRVGRRFTISGRLRGVSRGGVTVILQGRRRGGRSYVTFADTTSTSSGRFRVRYRFKNPASRGRSFVFRARIRPTARFPYSTGYSRTVTVRVR